MRRAWGASEGGADDEVPGHTFLRMSGDRAQLAADPYVIAPVHCRGGRTSADLYQAEPDIDYRYRIALFTMREFLRGAVQLHILHHAALGEIHGAWMAEELARHGYAISPGSLYPTLHKMEADGLLLSHSQVVAGRPRRSYSITAAGQRALKETTAQLRELASEVLGEDSP
jgi:DNA-binding PadR family transcriptional regulator